MQKYNSYPELPDNIRKDIEEIAFEYAKNKFLLTENKYDFATEFILTYDVTQHYFNYSPKIKKHVDLIVKDNQDWFSKSFAGKKIGMENDDEIGEHPYNIYAADNSQDESNHINVPTVWADEGSSEGDFSSASKIQLVDEIKRNDLADALSYSTLLQKENINPKAIQGRKKTEFHNIPPSGIDALIKCNASKLVFIEVASAMSEGSRKYGRFNWEEDAIEREDYYNAFIRHYLDWRDGNLIDEDSGIHHMSKIIAGMIVVMDAELHDNIIVPKTLFRPLHPEYNEIGTCGTETDDFLVDITKWLYGEEDVALLHLMKWACDERDIDAV